MMAMMLSSGIASSTRPLPPAISADGGDASYAAFNHPSITNSGVDNVAPFVALASNEQAELDISGLLPSTAYRIEGYVYVSSAGDVLQIAIVRSDQSVIDALILNGNGAFSKGFTTDADNTGLVMHLSGNGGQFGLSYLRIVRV